MKLVSKHTELAGRMAAYCTRAVRNAGYGAYRIIKSHQRKCTPFSSLPDDLAQLAVYPPDIPTYFRAGACDISAVDDELSAALRTLPALKLEIVLRIFYLGQTESEAASELGITRDNVHYHKRQALKLLRRSLGAI